jgi:hypothetical protein
MKDQLDATKKTLESMTADLDTATANLATITAKLADYDNTFVRARSYFSALRLGIYGLHRDLTEIKAALTAAGTPDVRVDNLLYSVGGLYTQASDLEAWAKHEELRLINSAQEPVSQPKNLH